MCHSLYRLLKGAVYVCFSAGLILSLISCSTFEKLGNKFGDGLGQGLELHVDTLSQIAVGGVKTGLEAAELDVYLDSLITGIADTLNVSVVDLRDILLGEDATHLVAGLRDTLIGDVTKRRLQAIVDDLMERALGERTKTELEALRDELLGEALVQHFRALRDELTGEETEARLKALARAFVTEVGQSYVDELRPAIREDVEFTSDETQGLLQWIKDNLIMVIVVLGLVIAGLIWLTWYFRRKRVEISKKNEAHSTMVEILTQEIDRVRNVNPEMYRQMKEEIQTQAVQKKVEKPLREILDNQGILRSK